MNKPTRNICPFLIVRRLSALMVLLAGCILPSAILAAEAGKAEATETHREIFVPYEDLHVLLEDEPRRVMLSREQYNTLLRQARKTSPSEIPHEALFAEADYTITIQGQRARVRGVLGIEVLE